MSNGIRLKWTETGPADSYNIKRGTVQGQETQYATSTVPTFDDTNGAAGTTYFYVVTAVLGGIESGPSNEASAVFPTVPASPTGLTAVPF